LHLRQLPGGQRATAVVGRGRELAAADAFLDELAGGTADLVLEGEAGIGKTTLWRETLARAEERSYRVLSARPAESEATLSFAVLGDLLASLDERILAELPEPQRRALDTALLRREPHGGVDRRALGAEIGRASCRERV